MSAERHLIEAYREEVAELLLRASEIAYWKTPVFSHHPLDASGRPFDPAVPDQPWRNRVQGALAARIELTGAGLLRGCLEMLHAEQAMPLAQASLALVPCDKARVFVAAMVPWDNPRLCVHLLERMLTHADTRWMLNLLSQFAARLCALELLEDAREVYRRAALAVPESPIGRCYSFSLSCFLGDSASAEHEARELASSVPPGHARILQAHDILAAWTRTQGVARREAAERVIRTLSDSLPEVVRPLCRAMQP
jgi:hypothetical protein